MKKFTVFNSSNPFCFNQNKLFNNCEISNIQINLRAPIGDFVIEFSNNLTNNKDDNVVYYRKQDLNIIGYGVLNGKNIDITMIKKNLEFNMTNEFSLYFRDIESRENLNFENLNYVIEFNINNI